MKKHLLWIGALVLCLPLLAHGQGTQPWSTSGTAETLEEGRWEMGLFQPLRWGVAEGLELSTYPLTSLISPNLELKRSYEKRGNIRMASSFGVTYPTYLFRLISREGTAGILPPDAEIPHMIGIDSAFYIGFDLPESHLLTLRFGSHKSWLFGKIDMPTIDLPIAYTRLGHYNDSFTFNFRALVDGPIWGPLYYSVDFTVHSLPFRESGTLSVEHMGLMTWRATDSFAMQLGYQFVYGQYPFGEDWHLLPLMDILFAW